MLTLYQYFGVVGIASVALWVTAWALGLAYALRWRKLVISRAALASAVVALLLAWLNSAAVGRIQIDPTQPAAVSAADPVRNKAVDALKKRAADIHFAEDSNVDALDLGGAGANERKAVVGQNGPPTAYDYHQQGKQQRAAGMNRGQPEGASPAANTDTPRFLPEADVIRANQWDSANLTVVRFTLLAAVALFVIDYLRRFNRTLAPLVLLPLAGPMIDSLFPKTHTVCLRRSADDDGTVQHFLEKAVRKGETFIYMGLLDLWPRQPSLPRLAMTRNRFRIDKLACDAEADDSCRDFAFEAAWFGRACVTATDADAAEQLLDHTTRSLDQRARTKVAARRTVNLVSDMGSAPSAGALASLAALCRANNFRLVVVTSQPPAPNAAILFDEIHDGSQAK